MSIDKYGEEMSHDEIASFLESQGVGTLAFGNETGGYAIPMSFGYDRTSERCIFQFAFGDESRKAAFIEEGNSVTLSVSDWNSVDDWQSVVLHGSLHLISDADTAKAAGYFAAQAKIASLEVFKQPPEELEFEWHELRIEEQRGRAATL